MLKVQKIQQKNKKRKVKLNSDIEKEHKVKILPVSDFLSPHTNSRFIY